MIEAQTVCLAIFGNPVSHNPSFQTGIVGQALAEAF
jgi:hypothetical protein